MRFVSDGDKAFYGAFQYRAAPTGDEKSSGGKRTSERMVSVRRKSARGSHARQR